MKRRNELWPEDTVSMSGPMFIHLRMKKVLRDGNRNLPDSGSVSFCCPLDGKVQVGISLMPEQVRKWLAPNGSPAGELPDGLAWAWSAGAVDPVIRLTVIWQQKEVYPDFLKLMRDCLGTDG